MVYTVGAEVACLKTRSAKNKGMRAQKEAAAMIKEHIESTVGITLDPRDVGRTIASEPGVDIKLSPLAESYFPFSVEVKNVEKLNIWSALKQAEENTLPNTQPMLMFRRNNERMWVCLPAEAYFQKK